MARSAIVFEILIASPSDVPEERNVVRDAIHEWNIVHGRSRACLLEPVMWETHSSPEFGDRPQAIINRQLVDTCDALIGTFWARLGTPTTAAPSGTIEEIDRLSRAQKPVILYFSSRPIEPDRIESEQLEALRAFKDSCRSRGLFDEYATPAELHRKLPLGLTRLTDTLLKTAAPSESAGQDESAGLAGERTLRLRQILKKWRLNTKLEYQGHDDGKDLMAHFIDWYVENDHYLTTSATEWETLADLAKQLSRYYFSHGDDSSEKFYAIGDAVLTNAVTLLETGKIDPPVGDLALGALRALHSIGSPDNRASAERIASSLSCTLGAVQEAIKELERSKLINEQLYINAPIDYGLTGAGLVCYALHAADGLTA